MTEKDQKIIQDSERLEIPIFVLTAKDGASLSAIKKYLKKCKKLKCDKHHLNGILKRIHDFEDWQYDNDDKVKIPD